jgi:hypothetical protein
MHRPAWVIIQDGMVSPNEAGAAKNKDTAAIAYAQRHEVIAHDSDAPSGVLG